jgi:negative regulator of sigma E activity
MAIRKLLNTETTTQSRFWIDIGIQTWQGWDLINDYLRNNSTVFEELEVSIVDLTVANAVLLATRPSVRPRYFSSHFSQQLLMAEI